MAEVKCFWLERLPRIRRYLRRFRMSSVAPCPAGGPEAYCNALAFLDEIDFFEETIFAYEYTHKDGRWPTVCENCKGPFRSEDYWQVYCRWLYRRVDTGEIVTTEEAPPGAMWDSHWLKFWAKEDGICLTVKLPNGRDWIVDCPSIDGQEIKPGRWIRCGVPPGVSVTPSIICGNYHGHLIEGVFRDA